METPEFFQSGYYDTQFTPEKGLNTENFVIEDLLDFPNDETMDVLDEESVIEGAMTSTGTSTDSSTVTTVAAVADNSSFQHTGDIIGGTPGQFSSELCVPYDDMAELEWLSHFVDESFSSSEDLQKLHLIQGTKGRTTTEPSSQSQTQTQTQRQYHFQAETNRSGPIFRPEITVPAKARSKRSRAPAGNWSSRLLVVSPPTPTISSSSTESDMGIMKTSLKKKEVVESGGEGRKCLHCATDKTPQWRTGPMGPKTLCNACGVRFKSGRLVPEYRPAASPTFVQARHSNSHRKVLELRRQKEMVRVQQHQQHQFMHHHHNHHQNNMNMNMMYDSDDYLIHQHIGPDYRQII